MLRVISKRRAGRPLGLLLAISLMSVLLSVGTAGTPAHADPAPQKTFYVSPSGSDLSSTDGSLHSPFATVGYAQDRVRDYLNANSGSITGDIYVYLRGGTYEQSSTLAFTAADSGVNGHDVVYKAFASEKPVISGGETISPNTWELDPADSTNRIYRTNFGTTNDTRELFVNGVRAVRAKSTYGAPGWPSAYVGFGNLTNVEAVFKGAVYQSSRCPLKLDSSGGLTMQSPCNEYAAHGPLQWVENAKELLDSPREWYLDRSTGYLYYMPGPGEDLATATVTVPVLEKLMTVSGTSTTHVSHLRFEGITFSYATWLRTNAGIGYPSAQAGISFAAPAAGTDKVLYTVPGNVELSYADDITISDGAFTAMGGNALMVKSESQNVSIRGNVFSDISHNGMTIGRFEELVDPSHPGQTAADRAKTLKNIVVENNLVTRVGAEYVDAVGVLAQNADLTIRHNDFFDIPNTAVTMTRMGTFRVTGNLVYDNTLALADGGGIYTNGTAGSALTSSVTIDNNYIHHQGNDVSEIYIDDNSKNEKVYDNVTQAPAPPGWSILVKDAANGVAGSDINEVYHNYYEGTIHQGYCTHSLCNVHDNYPVSNGAWPAAAQAIMAAAGLEPAYQHLRGMSNMTRVPKAEITASAPSSSGYGAGNAVDGAVRSLWISPQWATGATPPQLTLALAKARPVTGLEVTPRHDAANNGNITGYKVETSTDGTNYTVVATGAWADDDTKKFVSFAPTNAKYVRLVVTSGVQNYAVISNIDVTYDPNAGVNIARQATATASSAYPGSPNVPPSAAIDGVTGVSGSNEWVSNEAKPWLKLTWPTAQVINAVTLYDRVAAGVQVTGATLVFDDGSTVPVGTLPDNGTPVTISFPKKTSSTLTLQVTSSITGGSTTGISEIEVMRPSVNVARQAMATTSSVYPGSPNVPAPAAIDGVTGVSGYNEWVSNEAKPWLKLTWATPQVMNAVTLFDRVAAGVQVTGGTLIFDDGSTVPVGTLPDNGTPVTVTFPDKTSSTLTFQVTSSITGGSTTGLSEIEVTRGTVDVAPFATVSATSEDATSDTTTDDKVIDGSTSTAWVSAQSTPSLTLRWDARQSLSSIVLYDRQALGTQVTGGELAFSDGSTVPVGALPDDGSPLTVQFSNRNVSWVTFRVTSSLPGSGAGLAEIKAF